MSSVTEDTGDPGGTEDTAGGTGTGGTGAAAATPAAGTVRPETARPVGRIRAFLRLVMIEHSVFALPFAYLASLTAMFLADRSVHWWELFLVTVAMVSLRTFAMAANRIIDREIDARNPRTATRELVTGAVSVRTAWAGALVALAVFLTAAALLNPLCLALAPVAVVPMVVYPYGKRFTDFPHAILGLAQAIGPVGAWLAVTGAWSWEAVVLGLAVGTWIGCFDLIYACQDTASDRANGVRSVPARFGVAGALYGARAGHAVTVVLLGWYGALTGAGVAYWAGLSIVAVAFVYEHGIVRPGDLSRVNRAFFTVNGFVGIALFLCALIDLVLRGLTV
ncbi:menaquinone biosynthesis prenyltransferase MqnP [Streptomyces sp. TRM 70361]|uniref:menaquinone biosynthesis prenyltransferase MqnP n=1 Tax=Streptomyces sp. TRM 70361 TaxID=3116553 RepID=UPI002E7C4926|nr:menaquinone biosynthesis prenyltransferase MqnP [Streptomyces sp. TRM 70361]MEE1940414.1 menaquinone biosynthesis prenyltransferase MqnP [Streptomyces sp. TRM 70361]